MKLLLYVLLALNTVAFAQNTTASETVATRKKLKVLAKPVEPFVIPGNDGGVTGYSIDLWSQVAKEAGLEFELELCPTVPEAIDKVKAQQADVAIGAFSITAEREAVLDFSHSFYESGLKIMAPKSAESTVFTLLRGFLKRETFQVLGILLGALFINSLLLWFFEHRHNEESFPKTPVVGITEAAWWSVSTLITGGCENKAPVGHLGRVTAIVWMLAGVGLVSYVTATFASTMTVSNLTGDIKDLKSILSLPSGGVGTIGGSAAARFLSGIMGKNPPNTEFKTVQELCGTLARGEKGLKAVVYDEPLLSYYLANHPSANLTLVGDLFNESNYAFVLQKGSPLRKDINLALLRLFERGVQDQLRHKYLVAPASQ